MGRRKNNLRLKRNRRILFVVSAPSGTGKTTLCERVISNIPGLARSISCTTRLPRGGEINKKDYHFISKADFDRMISQGKFAEWAVVYGNKYGTLKETIVRSLEKNQDILLQIDVQGARMLSEKFKGDVVTIFLLPPSLGELRRRLERRGKDTWKKMEMRLRGALRELPQMVFYDYIVLNESLKEASEKLGAIIIAERQRRERLIRS
mgnify:CR=1 FL=1